jgi:DNA end-binding protein Ku
VPRERAGPRPFWSGTITFGLVSVPVDLYPAVRRNRVSLRLLGPAGRPLARRYFRGPAEDDGGDGGDGKELSRDEILRGFESDDGTYVVIGDEELEAVAPEKSRDIDLTRFVDAEAVDPIYFQRSYFLTPAGDSTKAYRLLAAVMERTGRAGIATFVMRGKEYLVAILAEGGILRAETLRFHDEVRSAEDVGLPDPGDVKVPKALEQKVKKAIRAAAAEGIDEEEMRDEDARRLLAVVERKRRAGEDVVEAPGAEPEEEEEGGAEVIDLMEVIKRNLAGGGVGGGRRPARRAPRRKPAAGEKLEALPKSELYERAKAADLPGRSSMSKAELVRALRRSA